MAGEAFVRGFAALAVDQVAGDLRGLLAALEGPAPRRDILKAVIGKADRLARALEGVDREAAAHARGIAVAAGQLRKDPRAYTLGETTASIRTHLGLLERRVLGEGRP